MSRSVTPMSLGKGLALLTLLYAIIGGWGVWRVWRNCLLYRDDCSIDGTLDFALNESFTLVGSLLMVAVLVTVTVAFVKLARSNKLGIGDDEEEDDTKKFNANGLFVALVVNAIYFGGAMAVVAHAAQLPASIERIDALMWRGFFAIKGSALVFLILWHVNDSVARPAPKLVLFLLSGATFGTLFWFVRAQILTF